MRARPDQLPGTAIGQHGTHRHLALPLLAAGELDRISDQVGQCLTQPRRITRHLGGDSRVGEQRQFHPLFLGNRGERFTYSFDDLGDTHGHRLKLELAGFNLGKIEDVVDDAQQRQCRFMNDIGHFNLRASQAALLQHFDHADHSVHRRAYLVAHGSEKSRFDAVCLFGFEFGPLQIGGARRHFFFQLVVEATQRRLGLLAFDHGKIEPEYHDQENQQAGKRAGEIEQIDEAGHAFQLPF